jgi:Cysteine-rich CPCC
MRSESGVNRAEGRLVHLVVGKQETRFRCPCCGYRTLTVPAAMALCPVCWWEDDGQEDADAEEVRLTVNGQLSLSEAREHYASCGAAHPRFLPYVRKPAGTEM